MTVCIAALCREEDDQRVVVAADRMVTLGNFIEFEHAVPKMTTSPPYAVAMVAGDTLTGTRLVQEVAASVSGASPPVLEIAQRMAAHYEATRSQRIEQHILSPRGLTFGAFYQGHSSFNAQITMMLDQQISQFNLGVEILLAGVDTTGAHIYAVHNPGRPEMPHDVIGYAAVGSGTIHALQSMIGFGHAADAPYHETVFRVYASKRRAEVAPGVGLDTDMGVISANGTHWLTNDELDQLKAIYQEFESATSTALANQLSHFSLGAPGEDRGDVRNGNDTTGG
jgi:hypothetical protein